MASELKPCPFCGAPEDELMIFADPEEAFDNSGPSRRIQCAGCHIEAPFYPSEAEAVAAWNTRPAPVDANPLASNPVDDKIAPDTDGNAPAATDTGLETVEHQYWHDQTQEWLPTGFPDRYRKDGFLVRELVTRSQAEELLAAEIRRERDLSEKQLSEVVDRMSDDYLALKAELDQAVGVIEDRSSEHEALEAKLAAAEKALEPFADIADLIDAETEGMAETDELVLHFHDYEFAKWPVSLFRKVRAVLGGKP